MFRIISILLGLTFITSAILKLYPIEPFELILVSNDISNWLIAPFFTRIIIGIELILALLLIIGFRLRQFSIPIGVIFLIILSIFSFYLLITRGNNADCGCFGEYFIFSPIESILKNFILIILFTILYFNEPSSLINSKWIVSILSIVLIITPFIVNPIVLENNLYSSENLSEISIDYSKFPKAEATNFREGKRLLVFFSTTCTHCKLAAKKLKILNDQLSLPPTFVFFIGENETLEKFIEETELPFEHTFFTNNYVFQITKGIFPTILFVENGVIIKKWTGGTLLYSDLQNMNEILEVNQP